MTASRLTCPDPRDTIFDTRIEWVNPHAYVQVDVKDDNGKVTTHAFASLSPSALARRERTLAGR